MGCSGSKDQASTPAAKPAAKAEAKPAEAADGVAASGTSDAENTSINLIYFNGKGRAEIIRLLLTLNKREFTDTRISFAEWPELKPKTPLGTLPVVEYDGKMFGQSAAIARYWARNFGLTGCNNAESALIDDVVDFIADIMKNVISLAVITDEDKKAVALAECIEKCAPMMERLDSYMSKSTSGYVVGDSITWGDYSLFIFCETFAQLVGQETLDKSPCLCTHYKKIMESPGVSEYIAARPANDF